MRARMAFGHPEADGVDDFLSQGRRIFGCCSGDVLPCFAFNPGDGLVCKVMIAQGSKAAYLGTVASEAPAFGPVLTVAACVHPG